MILNFQNTAGDDCMVVFPEWVQADEPLSVIEERQSITGSVTTGQSIGGSVTEPIVTRNE